MREKLKKILKIKVKGFTLIELLAVIVILAVIALIATPTVMRSIESSRKETFKIDAYGIYSAAEKDYMTRQLDNVREEVVYQFDNYEQTVTPSSVSPLSISGRVPRYGEINVDEYGNITFSISNGVWCAISTGSLTSIVLVPDEEGECSPEIENTIFTFLVDIPTGSLDFGFAINTSSEVLIDWGDENSTSESSDSTLAHVYDEPGQYEITVFGQPSRISFCKVDTDSFMCDSDATPSKITSITSQLPTSISSTNGMFENANSFNDSLEHLNTSNVTDMEDMFRNAISFNGNISTWDTSNVTNMSGMFINAPAFNSDISGWDTSSVEDMSWMFYYATSFNGNLNTWDTSNVQDLAGIFNYATSFNQDLDQWDTSSVNNLYEAFYNATSFNGNINTWDTSNVEDMAVMFRGATSFNQDLEQWDTSNVLYMYDMFRQASNFNGDVSTWDTSSVVDMQAMFRQATAFNSDISTWDTSSVTTMGCSFCTPRSGMFQGATSFNQDISGWDVSNVNDMSGLFQDATSFNQDLSSWCVTDISSMPSEFDTNASAWTLPRPVWGTCP